MTKERPILFSTEMVNAILEETKTQTRRKCKNQCVIQSTDVFSDEMPVPWPIKNSKLDKCPYGIVGDVLWVRESFAL